MKIAVMGAGAVGGYFGARLAADGNDVAFIARGAHLKAIRESGLRVLSENGDVLIHPATATDNPADIGPVDVVMFCVKLWDTEAAAEQIRPMIGPNTAVVSFQNGVYAEQKIGELLGDDHVIGGIAVIPAVIEEPGVIRHTGTTASLEFGEMDNRQSDRVMALLAACESAGIPARLPEDIEESLWRKYVMLTAFSAATCLCRSTFGPIRDDAQGMELMQALLSETAAVARAKGVAIAPDLHDRLFEGAHSMPREAKSSMLQDLDRGNRLELDYLSGTVVRMGAELGIDTPAHRVAWQALHPYAAGSG